MQLTYRGNTYTPNYTQVEMAAIGLKATYRGATYSIQRAVYLPLQPKLNLTYRGVPHVRGSQESASVEIIISAESLRIN